MTFELNIPATVAIISFLLLAIGLWLGNGWIIVPSALVLFGSSMTYCENRPEKIAERRAEAEQARRDAIPHVIREADGCKVYAFKNGDWHYFTRCGTTVTTERNYTVPVKCGKNCTKQEPRKEVIVTEENK